MPCIETKVNVEITKEKEKALKQRFGKAIALLPGKSESWLMLTFQDNCRMYFKGENDSGIAFIEVKIFGTTGHDNMERLTAELCHILKEELSIAPDKVYVKYEEVKNWGWNGGNF